MSNQKGDLTHVCVSSQTPVWDGDSLLRREQSQRPRVSQSQFNSLVHTHKHTHLKPQSVYNSTFKEFKPHFVSFDGEQT